MIIAARPSQLEPEQALGQGLAALWAGIRVREEVLELGQDRDASCPPGDQGGDLKLLHTDCQVGRVSSGSGPLSGRSGRSLRKPSGWTGWRRSPEPGLGKVSTFHRS